MATFNDIQIFLEFEPIVKVVCEAFDCRFNLMNDSNTQSGQIAACNLKQITIGSGGKCLNYRHIDQKTHED